MKTENCGGIHHKYISTVEYEACRFKSESTSRTKRARNSLFANLNRNSRIKY